MQKESSCAFRSLFVAYADSSGAKPAMAEGVIVLRIYYNELGHIFALVTYPRNIGNPCLNVYA